LGIACALSKKKVDMVKAIIFEKAGQKKLNMPSAVIID
jgi:hypothetical protein